MCSVPVTFGGGIMMQYGGACRRVGARREVAARFPARVPALFDVGGRVGLVHDCQLSGSRCRAACASTSAVRQPQRRGTAGEDGKRGARRRRRGSRSAHRRCWPTPRSRSARSARGPRAAARVSVDDLARSAERPTGGTAAAGCSAGRAAAAVARSEARRARAVGPSRDSCGMKLRSRERPQQLVEGRDFARRCRARPARAARPGRPSRRSGRRSVRRCARDRRLAST